MKERVMPSHEQMVAAVHAYVDAFAHEDSDAITQLYAADATVEDPIGTPLRSGIEAIRDFYQMSVGTGAKLKLEGPVRTAGSIAAFAFSVHVTLDGSPCRIDVIDTFNFDSSGKIAAMKAFWGPLNVHQLA
jgi:steroid delta-isomerase